MDSHHSNPGHHHHHRRRDSTSKRSRSPHRSGREDVKRHRSRSPRRKHHHHDRPTNVRLPYKQTQLKKDDFAQYKALFAEYLDIQKSIDIEDISPHEVKGRWKSFLSKWNAGELAQGWYDPEMKERVDERWKSRPAKLWERKPIPSPPNLQDQAEVDEDDDGYGPALPSKRSGPAVPHLDDLQHRQELADQDRTARIADLRYERKADRNLQKERIEEIAPRADPGSRERQMEKKQLVTAVNREFKDAKDGGDVEIGDSELMGGDDSADAYKRQMKDMEKKKNEREVRKEEVLRARAAEREERLQVQRAKEEKTMSMLRDLAKERFG